MPSILGIDSGLTVTKAAIFDIDGTPIAVARRRVSQSIPLPRHVERDMDELWTATRIRLAAHSNMARLVSTISADWWNTMSSVMADIDMNATSARNRRISRTVMWPMKALHQV